MISGSGIATTATTYNAATTLHLWWHYKNDGTGGVAVSTSSTRPSLTTYTGGATAALTKMQTRAAYQTTIHFDNLFVNSTEFTSVP